MISCGTQESIRDFVNRAVASGGSDNRDALGCRLKCKFFSMAWTGRGLKIGLRAQELTQTIEPPRRPSSSGSRVIDYADIRRNRGHAFCVVIGGLVGVHYTAEDSSLLYAS